MTPARSSTLYTCVAALAFAFAASMLGLAISTAWAASGNDAQDARDAAAVNAVKLDMTLVTRVANVSKQTHATLEKTCLLGRGSDTDKAGGLEVCGDALGKLPSLRQALAANGLSGRQFVLGYSALLAAVMGGRGVMENATEGWNGVRELGINPEHVRFYLAHHVEIDRLDASGND